MTVKELRKNLEDFSDEDEVIFVEWVDCETKRYHLTRAANLEHQKEKNQLWVMKNELSGLIK